MQKHKATIKELAAALDVSISTVSRALQGDPRIGLRTRMRVQEMAQKMHYTPNPAAVLLRKKQTLTIGVLVPWFREEFFSLAITGMEDVLIPQHFHPIISQSRDQLAREKMAIQSFITSRVDGVIASLAAETASYEHLEALRDAGIPIVFFDRVPRRFPAHQVRGNVMAGVQEAVAFLVGRGVSRLALLNGPLTLDVARERLEGFQAAARQFGLDVPPGYIKYSNLSAEQTRARMLEILRAPLRPEAVLAFNDYVALDAMQVCKQQGIVPNKDIFFVSFANLPVTAYLDNPPLASVEQFAVEMGEEAARLMLSVVADEAPDTGNYLEVVLDTKLVVH